MDLSKGKALNELYQALGVLRDLSWDLTVHATYGASPDEVVGIDVRLSPPTPMSSDEPPASVEGEGVTDGLMTIKEVAQYLGVSPRTVQTIVAEGGITPIKVRSQTRFDRHTVEAYVRSCARNHRTRRVR